MGGEGYAPGAAVVVEDDQRKAGLDGGGIVGQIHLLHN